MGCDIAVVLHSKTVDKVATTDGTAKPNDDRITYLPKCGTEQPSRQLGVVPFHSKTGNSQRAGPSAPSTCC